MNKLTQKREGFTIIEVVLVLAIVGLIMLMIFIAWPALQRGQRDTARKNDANTVASAISSYRSNNNGSNPTTFAELSGYLTKLSQYEVQTVTQNEGIQVTSGAGGGPTAKGVLVVRTKAKCSGSTAIDGTSRQAAVLVSLEANGGSGVVFCQDA